MKEIERFINSYKFYITIFIAKLWFITTLTSVVFGGLNKRLNISGDVDYEEYNKYIKKKQFCFFLFFKWCPLGGSNSGPTD